MLFFDTKKLRWTFLAELNRARSMHSSCAASNTAFIFGGTNSNNAVLRTVEIFDFQTNSGYQTYEENLKDKKWQEFTIADLTPRMCALVAPLSKSTVMIMGGVD